MIDERLCPPLLEIECLVGCLDGCHDGLEKHLEGLRVEALGRPQYDLGFWLP